MKTSNDLQPTKMGYFILNRLGETSTRIKNKIDLIYSSNIDYDSFEKFKIEMETFERFNFNTKGMEDYKIRETIFNFSNEFEKALDTFIQKINDNKKDKEIVDAKVNFFEIVYLMAEFKQMREENVSADSLINSLTKLDSLIDYTLEINKESPSLNESEIATLKESKESVKELMNELMTIEANDNVESDKNNDDETNKNRRQQ